jgi:hypothetical protein
MSASESSQLEVGIENIAIAGILRLLTRYRNS